MTAEESLLGIRYQNFSGLLLIYSALHDTYQLLHLPNFIFSQHTPLILIRSDHHNWRSLTFSSLLITILSLFSICLVFPINLRVKRMICNIVTVFVSTLFCLGCRGGLSIFIADLAFSFMILNVQDLEIIRNTVF